ncbi:Transcription initiation factor TFIID subunit 12 [Pseudocercospora fuligena]|uniref:Transcription initiation factor TFIID subunit 12 n=1 Tax=Pseudocercospora fuligena TaxID=685502 RepID=A0A8H6RT22_9PEZI|nr:Transcription initiation factor TFIID subunit 12 [Pseudocercospora fuligena]
MAQPSQTPLIKPSQIDQLPFLQADAKEQYKNGLANLWQQYENNPEGSPARQAAHEKIKTASTKLLSQLANRNRPQSAGQPRPGSQQAGASQQQGGQNQMTPQQMQAAAQARAAQQQQQQQQGGGGQPGQQGQMRQCPIKLSPQAQTELDSVQLAIPQEQQPRWRQQAFAVLAKRDQIFAQATRLQQGMKQMQSSGQQVPQQTQIQFAEAKKAAEMATRNWRSTKLHGEGKTEEQIKQILAQEDQQRQLQQQQRMGNQQGVNHQQQSQMQQQAPQQSTADSKAPAQDQQTAASPSPAQPQTGFQQQSAQSRQGTPIQNQQQQQPPTTQPQQQTPQTATQPQPPQAFPQAQQGMQQPQRPQINTQMSSQMGQQQQSMPQSANQQNPQRPQVLNHQQAMSQAAATYQQQNNQGPQQGQQPAPMPNGLPFSGNQPASATQQNTPTYPNLATTQQQSATTKFPIPKQLQLDPRSQGPVPGPPSRPTLNNAGAMYNPGIQRAPPYTLEGEGDRVLSKRKLDELVRQVTGSAPASSDSESSSVLNPDVEECILEMTDNFVDEVITSACRLAKLRPGQTLDLRDIQITLERNYGIRIPGYSLDEVRTVKKFQPAAGWTTKMQAVQTGKIVNNKDA